MKSAFVTGASGFIGRHLVARLREAGWRVAASRRGPDNGSGNGVGTDLGPSPWTAQRLAAAFDQAGADVVFHMAGLTRAPSAAALYEANTVLAAQVLEAAAQQAREPLVVLAGSAAEYGPVPPEALPVSETWCCHPSTDYAVSKHAQTLMALARAASGQRVAVARIWNPVGAGMPGHLALASFAAQIAAVPTDGGVLRAGNLDVARDFIEAGELARLLLALADRPDPPTGVINLCSGRAYVLRGLVDELIRLGGRRVEVVIDPARMRAGEAATLYGDTSRLAALGLHPAAPDFNVILPALLAAFPGPA